VLDIAGWVVLNIGGRVVTWRHPGREFGLPVVVNLRDTLTQVSPGAGNRRPTEPVV
jgi:hypothetical protein